MLPQKAGPTELKKLQDILDKMLKRLDELEVSLKEIGRNHFSRFQCIWGRSKQWKTYIAEILDAPWPKHSGYVWSWATSSLTVM